MNHYYVSFEELEEILPADIEDLVMYYYKQMQDFPHFHTLRWKFDMNPPSYKNLDFPTIGRFTVACKRIFYYSYDHHVNLYTIYGTLNDGRYYFDQQKRHIYYDGEYCPTYKNYFYYKEHPEKYEKLKKIEGQLMTRKQVRYFNYENFIVSSTPLSCNCMRCQIYRVKRIVMETISEEKEVFINPFNVPSFTENENEPETKEESPAPPPLSPQPTPVKSTPVSRSALESRVFDTTGVEELSEQKKEEIRKILSNTKIQNDGGSSENGDPMKRRTLTRKKSTPSFQQTKYIDPSNPQMIRKAKIITVEGYLKSDRFGDYLCRNLEISPNQARLMSIEQLEDIHQEIRCLITKRYKEKFIENLTKIGLKTIEAVVTPMYNITGFEDILMNNQEFLDFQGPPLPLGIRLSLSMVQTAILCNQINSLTGDNVQIHPAAFHARTAAPPNKIFSHPRIKNLIVMILNSLEYKKALLQGLIVYGYVKYISQGDAQTISQKLGISMDLATKILVPGSMPGAKYRRQYSVIASVLVHSATFIGLMSLYNPRSLEYFGALQLEIQAVGSDMAAEYIGAMLF
ncbi:hypothetical protein RFI_34357 [Reticulomyxa filosa]|uniref:Uncharacterized protein n=1 Tax=Reticulomyxa filosa TaxID=46433 RepID=X6LPI4_RETFI|nr:hypothetical protein RFI_34357 [Reticulomyxa filosa]|eukprot:ETO03052.1 hypothetical protein RFI_34357 [Reticulomyxa filosa]